MSLYLHFDDAVLEASGEPADGAVTIPGLMNCQIMSAFGAEFGHLSTIHRMTNVTAKTIIMTNVLMILPIVSSRGLSI
jgi:hypothetical protein